MSTSLHWRPVIEGKGHDTGIQCKLADAIAARGRLTEADLDFLRGALAAISEQNVWSEGLRALLDAIEKYGEVDVFRH